MSKCVCPKCHKRVGRKKYPRHIKTCIPSQKDMENYAKTKSSLTEDQKVNAGYYAHFKPK